MIALGPELLSALSAHELELLRKETESYAFQQMARFRWRGAFGGILPEGFAPSSIAAQAFTDLLSRPTSPGQSNREPALAFVQLRHELRYLVRKQVNRLHHLKETSLLRNVADLPLVCSHPDLPLIRSDGVEWVTPIESFPAPDPSPAENLLRQEAQADLRQRKARFLAFLGNQRRLKTLFSCLSAGISRPGTLARRLRTQVSTVRNLTRRLHRQSQAFQRHETSAHN